MNDDTKQPKSFFDRVVRVWRAINDAKVPYWTPVGADYYLDQLKTSVPKCMYAENSLSLEDIVIEPLDDDERKLVDRGTNPEDMLACENTNNRMFLRLIRDYDGLPVRDQHSNPLYEVFHNVTCTSPIIDDYYDSVQDMHMDTMDYDKSKRRGVVPIEASRTSNAQSGADSVSYIIPSYCSIPGPVNDYRARDIFANVRGMPIKVNDVGFKVNVPNIKLIKGYAPRGIIYSPLFPVSVVLFIPLVAARLVNGTVNYVLGGIGNLLSNASYKMLAAAHRYSENDDTAIGAIVMIAARVAFAIMFVVGTALRAVSQVVLATLSVIEAFFYMPAMALKSGSIKAAFGNVFNQIANVVRSAVVGIFEIFQSPLQGIKLSSLVPGAGSREFGIAGDLLQRVLAIPMAIAKVPFHILSSLYSSYLDRDYSLIAKSGLSYGLGVMMRFFADCKDVIVAAAKDCKGVFVEPIGSFDISDKSQRELIKSMGVAYSLDYGRSTGSSDMNSRLYEDCKRELKEIVDSAEGQIKRSRNVAKPSPGIFSRAPINIPGITERSRFTSNPTAIPTDHFGLGLPSAPGSSHGLDPFPSQDGNPDSAGVDDDGVPVDGDHLGSVASVVPPKDGTDDDIDSHNGIDGDDGDHAPKPKDVLVRGVNSAKHEEDKTRGSST